VLQDVVIVGGGPVGLGLAVSLGQRGRRVTVIEKHDAPLPIPRGQNLTQRTLEHFHFWGCEPALRAARTIPPSHGIGGMTSYGTLLSPYHYDWMKRELVRPFYYTENERLPQYATEAVLRARLAKLPTVDLVTGHAASHVEQDADGVTVTARPRAGGPERVVRAAFGVGCDGARSMVRESAGITETRDDHDRLMVLLVFRSKELHALLGRYPGKSFFCVLHPDLEGYWRFLGRVDLGESFFFHAPVPPGTTATNHDFAAMLHAAIGAPFALTLDHVGFWDLRIATADRYRAGRLFVAGDAAHSHPPYGGYGINTGFEDAVNLAWKLDAALGGWAGPGLLDSYEAERRPVFVSTARDFIEASIRQDRDFVAAYHPKRDRAAFEAEWARRASGAVGEVHAFEPNYEGSPVVAGSSATGPSARGDHRHEARAGHHLSPVVLGDGSNIYARLGPGFTLLTLGAESGVIEAFETQAQARGVPLMIVEDAASSARDKLGASLVLVRPDQFVAWAGETADAGVVLDRAIGCG